ncbi:MAG: hypothetical protein COA94_04730 [Rickettsiales bacterium]|nr:MAG: hypothetical protein COA94_04730 [Rickettsiales bacterium]
MIRLEKNFILSELVHPALYKQFKGASYNMLNIRLSPTLQSIRDVFGQMAINGFFKGRLFKDSGLRLPHGKVGAKRSGHKFGYTADAKFYDTTPIEVQRHILEHQEDFPYITRMEDANITKTWLHIEVGTNNRVGAIYVFKP